MLRSKIVGAAAVSIGLIACGGAAASGDRPAAPTAVQTDDAAGAAERPEAPADDGKPDLDDDDALIAELEAEDDEEIKHTPACFDLAGHDGCVGVGVVQLVCSGLGNILDASSHGRMLECLQSKHGSKEICEGKVLRTCGLSAIEATPVGPSMANVCDELLSKCEPTEENRDIWKPSLCRSGLSSLQSRPRDEFIGCMRERCDLRLCLGGML